MRSSVASYGFRRKEDIFAVASLLVVVGTAGMNAAGVLVLLPVRELFPANLGVVRGAEVIAIGSIGSGVNIPSWRGDRVRVLLVRGALLVHL